MQIQLFDGDISVEYYALVCQDKVVGIDLETSGLAWEKDKIAICQLHSQNSGVAIVRISQSPPDLVCRIIASQEIRKIFHFAVFDLRFMRKNWLVESANVVCTKVASKIIDPSGEHSLQGLLRLYLGINIDKSTRISNWFASELTEEQISYAAGDVMYLSDLYICLSNIVKIHGLGNLLDLSSGFIPVQVELDIMGISELFEY